MKIKRNAHHTIYLVHNCDLLPPVYIVDRIYSWRIKFKVMRCRYFINNSEPYSPWKKIVEYKNQESKRKTDM